MNSSDDFANLEPLFARLEAGDPDALGAILNALYGRLKAIAELRLRNEHPNVDLDDPDALINEAYLRIRSVKFRDPSHLLALAAQAMRVVLVDAARRRRATKRGDMPALRVARDPDAIASEEVHTIELLWLDEALEKLKKLDPRIERTVELRFFGGYDPQQIAAITHDSPNTVRRDLMVGRACLREMLSRTAPRKEPAVEVQRAVTADAAEFTEAREVVIEVDPSVDPDAFAEVLKALANYYRACGGIRLQATQGSSPSGSPSHHVQ